MFKKIITCAAVFLLSENCFAMQCCSHESAVEATVKSQNQWWTQGTDVHDSLGVQFQELKTYFAEKVTGTDDQYTINGRLCTFDHKYKDVDGQVTDQ